ncbi:MAG TPA: hypothetical protein VHG72_13945 [Polyangia bacterium]|nr:hypothetical protein [Polyangia bacterium]
MSEAAGVVSVTKRHVVCPSCNKAAGTIDHMIEDAIRLGEPSRICGWFCDRCGWEYAGTVYADGSATVEKTGKRKIETRVLLKLEPLKGDVFIEVEGMTFLGVGETIEGKDLIEDSRYYYEEHTCPTNYLRVVQELWEGDYGHDPHGMFRVVDVVPAPPEHTGVPIDDPFPAGVFDAQVRAFLNPSERTDA